MNKAHRLAKMILDYNDSYELISRYIHKKDKKYKAFVSCLPTGKNLVIESNSTMNKMRLDPRDPNLGHGEELLPNDLMFKRIENWTQDDIKLANSILFSDEELEQERKKYEDYISNQIRDILDLYSEYRCNEISDEEMEKKYETLKKKYSISPDKKLSEQAYYFLYWEVKNLLGVNDKHIGVPENKWHLYESGHVTMYDLIHYLMKLDIKYREKNGYLDKLMNRYEAQKYATKCLKELNLL